MSNYLNLSDMDSVRNAKGVVIDFDDYSDAEKQAALDMAEEIVHGITNNRFGPYNEVWLFDGNGSKSLRFPPVCPYPLLSINGVYEVDGDGDTTATLVENEDYVNRGHYLQVGTIGGGATARDYFTYTGDKWQTGLRNYKIDGVWGMNSVPETIKRVLKLIAAESLKKGSTKYDASEVESFSLGDYEVIFRNDSGPAMAAARRGTGFLYLDSLLHRYKNRSDLILRSSDKFGQLVSSEYAG